MYVCIYRLLEFVSNSFFFKKCFTPHFPGCNMYMGNFTPMINVHISFKKHIKTKSDDLMFFLYTSMVHQVAKEVAVSWNIGLRNSSLVFEAKI